MRAAKQAVQILDLNGQICCAQKWSKALDGALFLW